MANRLATVQDCEQAYPVVCGKVRQHHLDMAATFIALDRWGNKASFGHIEATCHFAARQPGSGISAAPATSKSMGSVSASYGVATGSDPQWGSTTFGLNFEALRDALFVGPVVGRRRLIVV